MANQLLPSAPYSLPCHTGRGCDPPSQLRPVFPGRSQSALCKRPRTLDRNSVDGPSDLRVVLVFYRLSRSTHRYTWPTLSTRSGGHLKKILWWSL